MSDETNPAVAKHVQVPPALLEAVAEDPSAAQPVFRVKTLLLAHELYQKRHTMTAQQQMALMESLAKMGNINPKENTAARSGGPGVSINIVLPGHKDKSVTVDAVTGEIED